MNEQEYERLLKQAVEILGERLPVWVVVDEPGLKEEVARLRERLDELQSLGPRGAQCRLAEMDGAEPGLLRVLTAAGGRPAALKDLRTFAKDAERLTIVDPYFFSANWEAWKRQGSSPSQIKAHVEDYVAEVERTVGGGHVLIEVFHGISPPREVANQVRKKLKTLAKHCDCYATSEIHDRVWIRDGNEAKVIGTSFSGMGVSKLAFMLDLPPVDLQEFSAALNTIRMAQRP